MSLSLLLTDKTLPSKKLLCACALSVSIVLSGCSNSGTPTSSLTGSVSAPGGSIAFNQPSGIKRMFAEMIGGKLAHAAITGVSSVGAGVTIELIEVDASGNQVGDAIASATTDASGAYSLTVISGFSPDSKYIIRATGTTESMDVRVTGTSNDIDPVTDAVSDLVTTVAADLSTISVTEITEIKDAMDGIAQAIDPTGLTAEALSAALKTEATDDEEFSNQLNSTAAAGSICGNVKDASGNNLENIKIIVRDFGNWVTRAKSKTDSSGNYCVSVPDGNYILGALNFTDTSMAASEWWHTSGNKYSQIDAEKITVSSSAGVTKNFSLEAGARLTGTVKAAAGGSLATGAVLEGVKVQIRNYQNFFPVGARKTRADGSYRINIIPGTYMVGATNRARLAYASEYYDGATGTNNRYSSAPVSLTAGNTTTIDFDLETGNKLAGTILDAAGGNPVTGMRVRINRNGPIQRLRTNKKGKYRIWLKPDTYSVQSYGQSSSVDMTAGNASFSPTGPVTTIATNINYNGTGVSQAKAFLLDNAGNLVSQEVSSGDGSVKLYCKTCATDYKVYVRIDEARAWASTVYDGKTNITTNATLVDATQTSMPDINLLAGGTLSVTVTSDGSTTQKNFRTGILPGSSGTDYLVKTQRSHGDGSYLLSLPAGTFRVQMRDDANVECTVTITAGATTTLTYRTDTSACG